jgi:hypothetical protein
VIWPEFGGLPFFEGNGVQSGCHFLGEDNNMRKSWSLCLVLCAAALAGGAIAADEYEFRGEFDRPGNALPGECWCLFTIPAQYKTVSERVCVEPARCEYEKVPAVFETRTERVCVKKESKRKITIPAEYRTETYQHCVKKACKVKEKVPAVYEDRTEQVCVKKESKKKVKIPAVFREEQYQVCVEPARTEWRRVDCNATNVSGEMREEKGECYCLFTIPAKFETRTRKVCVEKESCVYEVVPAVYETRTKRVCVKKESHCEVEVPAVFETRERRVCVRPESCTYEVIPAEFKTVEKTVCVKKESKRKIEIPARYETRTKEVCVSPARKVWRKTDCNVPMNTSYPAK